MSGKKRADPAPYRGVLAALAASSYFRKRISENPAPEPKNKYKLNDDELAALEMMTPKQKKVFLQTRKRILAGEAVSPAAFRRDLEKAGA